MAEENKKAEKGALKSVPEKGKNKMRNIRIEKVIVSVGGTAENLEKGVKLIEILTGKKASKRKSVKRIPSLGVRPGLEVGAMVTLRGEAAEVLLKRLLITVDKQLRRKQISENVER